MTARASEAPVAALGEALAARSGPARVESVQASGVTLRLEATGAVLAAEVAVPAYVPRVGDRVLAFVDEGAFVIGVLPARVSLVEEVLDEAARRDAEGPVEVRDRRGALLFAYDPATDRATLHVPDGDLELSVPEGRLSLKARDGVRVQSGEVEVLAGRLRVDARTVEGTVDRVKQVVQVLDLRAGRIVERAREVYREVEGLSQTRAGRLRLVAQKAAQLVGENVLLKARDRMKVKGERIHLA